MRSAPFDLGRAKTVQSRENPVLACVSGPVGKINWVHDFGIRAIISTCFCAGDGHLHYRHGFHAGNFADVFKHTLLCGLLLALNRKDKPWCFLDTHAGAGLYDLGAEGAQRTGEWQDGIGRLAAVSDAPEPFATYLRIVRGLPSGQYPGSPLFARALAREQDRLVLCEKVEEVAAELKEVLRGEPRVHIHRRDGYEAHALLPPLEKRGLVLVDPPFERVDELDAIAEFLVAALARFAGGVCAVWYPLKNRHAAGKFVRRVEREVQRPLLDFRFETDAQAEGQMRACGVLVVNPPYQFEADVRAALEKLVPLLAQGANALVETATYGPDR
jgi:23S rRNA (adenine2030-N6)-methyltransferase